MKVYNTITRRKEEFQPISEGKVSMYVCGPTVYNFMHIGNARPIIVFDTLKRYLEFKGYNVNHIQNYTDIDDKIIRLANEEGISSEAFAERYIAESEKDVKGLNVKPAVFNPKVTQEIEPIVEMIQTLIDKGFAYEKNGSVFFDTARFPEYGKLSKRDFENQEAGARIEVDEEKKSPMDFVLWKPKKEGEPYWESPWSQGRPGWHIECSAMAKKYLGETIDIHAGGEDLVFPHHENEIAQSEAANGKTFANYWMHNGFINIDNQKMSKSKGNFFTLREIAEEFGYDAVRFFLLESHYRSPINFSRELMEAAKTSLDRIKTCAMNLKFAIDNAKACDLTDEEKNLQTQAQKFKKDFTQSMEEDLNTADAIASIFDLVRFINRSIDESSSKEFLMNMYGGLLELCDILGIVTDKETGKDDEAVEKLIKERADAKKAKDFKRADEIREELLNMGVTIEDTRQGVRWYWNK